LILLDVLIGALDVMYLLTTHEAAWFIILVDSVCVSVCQTITFEGLEVGSSYLYLQAIWVNFVYEGRRVKVTGDKKCPKCLLPHFKL